MALNCPEAGKELATIVEGAKLQTSHVGLSLQAPQRACRFPGLLRPDLKLRGFL